MYREECLSYADKLVYVFIVLKLLVMSLIYHRKFAPNVPHTASIFAID